MIIIYPNGAGGISIVHPTGEIAIEEVARNDVPAGVPYRYVELEDFPLDGTANEAGEPNIDKTFREAWEADFNNPDGYGEQK